MEFDYASDQLTSNYYPSDESMPNSFEYDGAGLSNASDQTVILLGQPSSSEAEQSDDHELQEATSTEDTHSADLPVAISRSSSVHFWGYTYAPYHFIEEATHYRCSAYRRTQCKVKLYVRTGGAVVTGDHKPNCVPKFRRAATGPSAGVIDRKAEMLMMTDEICVRDVTLTPQEVWRMIRDYLYGNDNEIVRGATKKQVLGRLYHTRANLFGREIFGRLEHEPLGDVKHRPGLKFFQFHVTFYEGEVQHRLIGWAHPYLLDRMKQRQSSVFVDATYRALLTNLVHPHDWKNWTSVRAPVPQPLRCVREKNGSRPRCVRLCYVGKMLKLKITEPEIELAMREGCIDRLTVIRRIDISLRGIHDVRSMIKCDCRTMGVSYSTDNWKKFWKYFKKTWVRKFKPEWWNINSVPEDIVNRTNNPLERYNRTLISAFSTPHPDITRFISVIEEQSRENVRLLGDISNRRARAPTHVDSQRAPGFESNSELEIDSDLEVDGSDSDSDEDSTTSMSPEY